MTIFQNLKSFYFTLSLDLEKINCLSSDTIIQKILIFQSQLHKLLTSSIKTQATGSNGYGSGSDVCGSGKSVITG